MDSYLKFYIENNRLIYKYKVVKSNGTMITSKDGIDLDSNIKDFMDKATNEFIKRLKN